MNELSAALTLASASAVITIGLFVCAWRRGTMRRSELARSARALPEIQHALIDYLAGNNDFDRLRGLHQAEPQAFSQALLSYRNVAGGSARERLCELTLPLGLIHEWRAQTRARSRLRRRDAYAALAFVTASEPCRRTTSVILADALEHSDSDVRFAAAQALALHGGEEYAPRIFDLAVRETLLGRILLAEQLRPHALELCRKGLPEALGSASAETIRGALEIVVAWERALAIGGIEAHFQHAERPVRLAALRAAPFLMFTADLESAVTRCLADPDPEIAIAAVSTAARLRLQNSVPLLARCVRTGDAPLARTAAAALAALPPTGWKVLREFATSDEPVASGAAREALGRMQAQGAA